MCFGSFKLIDIESMISKPQLTHFKIRYHSKNMIHFNVNCFIIYNKNKFYFQSISEFLKNLPSHNEKNFALFNTENGIRTSSRRPSVYLPTVDIPSEQSKLHLWWNYIFIATHYNFLVFFCWKNESLFCHLQLLSPKRKIFYSDICINNGIKR